VCCETPIRLKKIKRRRRKHDLIKISDFFFYLPSYLDLVVVVVLEMRKKWFEADLTL